MATGVIYCTAGQGHVIDLIDLNTRSGVAGTYYGAWGAGGNTPVIGDTTLQTENAEARTSIPAGSMSQPTSVKVRWVYVIVATGTRTVQETGVFTASSGGVMVPRVVHGSLALESGDQVTYTIDKRQRDTTEA